MVDRDNQRVQVFDNGRNHLMTLGETGVSGDDFGHFQDPSAVTADEEGRIYVSDQWGTRVQVFDLNGAYLTTVGGNWGNRTGEISDTRGLAINLDGALFFTDFHNHRVQKFVIGVPGWNQDNLNGFGERGTPASPP